jgi:hypothetical protein
MKKSQRTVLALLIVGSMQYAMGGNVSIPHTFTANTAAKASEVNENFTALENALNDNTNKITTNTTAISSNTNKITANTTAASANAHAINELNASMGQVRAPAGYGVIYAGGNAWLDRNIGATAVASSWNDTTAEVLGDLFQWGRKADGHEERTSGTTTTCRTKDDTINNTDFITPINSGKNWRSINADCTGNADRTYFWSASGSRLNGVCPAGWVVPTLENFDALGITDEEDAFNKIKLVAAGHRLYTSGDIEGVGTDGMYWTANSGFDDAAKNIRIDANNGYNDMGWNKRAYGYSVRCMKELP